jgi:hypothetical protein
MHYMLMLVEQRGQEKEEVDGRGGTVEFGLGLLQPKVGYWRP